MPDSKISVLICIESFFDGGAEMFAIRLANALASSHNVYFLELDPYSTTEKNQIKLLQENNIKLFQPGINLFGNILFAPFFQRSFFAVFRNFFVKFHDRQKENVILKFISSEKIDVVHSHNWFTDFYFSRLKQKIDFKLVSSLHGHYEFLQERNDFEVKTRQSVNSIDTIVYLSESHLKTLDKFDVDKRKLIRIFYGLDFDANIQETSYDGGLLKILLVARGIPEKGWKQIVDAVTNLLKKYPGKIQLNLIGDGSFVDLLKSANSLPEIIFNGYQNEVSSFIANAHLCVLPSYYIAESLPNSIIEYLSFGKPVISTNVGAIPDMINIEDETAGVVLNLKNGEPDVLELQEAIESYIINPDLIKAHSALAIKASKKFLMSECASNYANAYAT